MKNLGYSFLLGVCLKRRNVNIGILEISKVPYLSNRVMDFENITISLCCSLGCVAPKTNYNTDPQEQRGLWPSGPSLRKLTKGTSLLLRTVFCVLPLIRMGSWPNSRVLLREGCNQVFEPTSVEITDAWKPLKSSGLLQAKLKFAIQARAHPLSDFPSQGTGASWINTERNFGNC